MEKPYTGPTIFARSNANGTLDFREAGGAEVASIKSELDNNLWRHFTFMKRGLIYLIFIGGELDNSESRNFGTARINDERIILGANQANRKVQNYNGHLDDLRIYSRALSDADVKALYEFERVK